MPSPHSSSRTAPRGFTAWLGAVALLSLIVRGFQLSQRTFYWDDFLIPATFSGGSLGDYFASYDGHLMPASALVQVLAHRIAPLNWWLPTTVLMLLSALAAALWAKVCVQLTGRSLATLGLYTALIFSPFLMDAAGWWSAGINALAWQIGMAGFMVCLLSSPKAPKALLRYSVFATGFLLIALLFTEKALTIVPAALALAVLVGMARRDIARFFSAPGALFVVWSLLFLTLSPLPREESNSQSLWSALPNSLFTTVIPGALGGPLSWDRWSPSSTFATAPTWWSIASIALLLVLVALWLRRDTRHRLLGLLLVLGYLAAIYMLLGRARNSTGTSGLLLSSMHYFADWFTFAVLVVGCCALSYGRPYLANRPAPSFAAARSRWVGVGAILSAVAISVTSTYTWVGAWSNDRTADYLSNLRASTKLDGSGEPPQLLDQPVPLDILTPVVHPYDRVSTLTGQPAVTQVDEPPRIIDESGKIVDAEVVASATSTAGKEPECGVRIAAGRSQAILLDNALPFGDWTWQLNATASTDMTLTITTPNGLEDAKETKSRAVDVHVGTELKPRWVRVSGGGGILLVRAEADSGASDESVCIGAGGIGPLVAKAD
ncbi:hypothetical protein [Corynebacterium sp. c24Ua_83]|uniref:hypothetical protein n=1 Tax=unclassified Corynebacterium TaxID=2624378 RepID=UPI001EF23E30|nr:hypothetical protein [Corynebacterium sp. ACRPH]